MSIKVTEQGVREIIAGVVERVCTDDLQASEDFYDFGFDSLDHAQILMRIEEVFGVLIAEDDLDDCRSIEAIIEYAARPVGQAC
ncbi:MAG: acyl carrier protein [Reyranella sp.]|uniref:acyl carrier protein n=1 Tax=Reyranella sp. TaxID=1929291 RepID=UPI00121D547A|nr:acyl carrier protein [Reyranella sp.]TAJ97412.1 MAG: acyl carrier protein [Reyranella sp.]